MRCTIASLRSSFAYVNFYVTFHVHHLTRYAATLLVLSSLCAFAQSNDVDQKGFPANGIYQKGDVDVVNVQNGNLHIAIPLVSLTQRGGSTVSAQLIYDTQAWSKQWLVNSCGTSHCSPAGWWVVGPNQQVPSGWRLSTSQDWLADMTGTAVTCPSTGISYTEYTNFVIYDPDGLKHPLSLRQEAGATCNGQTLTGPTTDGSGMTYDIPSGTIRAKNGTILNSPTLPGSMDANGNKMSVASDTLGRSAFTTTNASSIAYTTPLGNTITGPQYTNYNVVNSSGLPETFHLTYQAIDETSDICAATPATSGCSDVTVATLVYNQLTLPTGRAYTFTYANNTPGDLTRLDLPSGGAVKYTYGDFYQLQLGSSGVHGSWSGSRYIASRAEVIGGVANPPWSYAIVGGGTTVTDPVGNVQLHTYGSVVGGVYGSYRSSANQYETQVIYKDSSGTTLRTENTDYAAEADLNANTAINIRPIRKTITLDNGQQTKTETDYETFTYTCSTCYTSSGYVGIATRLNPVETRQYDYGTSSPGPLLKRVDYGYLHTGSSTYQSLNIVDRVTSVTVYDGSGTTASQASNEYDNYSHSGQPMLTSSAIQHSSSFGIGYTSRGNMTGASLWRNTDGAYLTTTFQFDDAGNKVSVLDPAGHKTSYDFTDSWADAACYPAGPTAAFATKVTNAKGQFTTATYHACTGLQASTIDLNGHTAATTYDSFDRIKTVTPPVDGGQKSYCYSDDVGGSCYDASHISILETDELSGSSNFQRITLFDGLGRESEVQITSDPNGTTYTDTKYDAVGRTSQISNPYRSGDTIYWTTKGYDGLGRLNSTIKQDGAGSTASSSFTGNATTITDESGKKRKSVSDGLGRVISVWEDPTTLNYETDYLYDVFGNLNQVTQKGGEPSSANWRVRTFTYNSLGQLLCSANPEIGSPLSSTATCPAVDTGSYIAGTVRYQYNNDGELTSRTAPLPNQTSTPTVTTSYTYDVLHRPSARTYTDGTPGVTYTHDADSVTACTAPSLTASNLIGHVKAMCDASGSTSWSYDTLGRTKVEARTIGSVTDQISYGYYLSGAINSVTYPAAGATTPFTMTYNQNSAGRIDTATGSDGVVYAHVSSTWASGASHSWQLGANIDVENTYNSRLQPSQMTATQISTTNTLFSRTYDFHLGSGDNGNLFGAADGLDGLGLNRTNGSVQLTYDAINRITAAQTPGTDCTSKPGGTKDWGQSFAVDAWGNLVAKTVTKCTATSLSSTSDGRNRLAAAGYDSAGNAVLNTGVSFTYDAEGRVISGGGTPYTYDGLGERVEKPGKLYWKGSGSTALMETDGSDRNAIFYVFFNGQRIARVDPSAASAKYYLTDNLNTTAMVTDYQGNVLNDSLYFPYGEERVIAQTDSGNNYKFTGKERDPETGLDDFGARYYASNIGRFMTPDWNAKPTSVPYATFGDPQTLNLYSYVENGPLNRVDADGHSSSINNASPVLFAGDPDDTWNCVMTKGHACTGDDVQGMISNSNGYHTLEDLTNAAAAEEEANQLAANQQAQIKAAQQQNQTQTATVIVTSDTAAGKEFGSHAAIWLDNGPDGAALYDPGGSYHQNTRGSSGVLTQEDDHASLQDYIKYQESTGSKVSTVNIKISAKDEATIYQHASENGERRGLNCAGDVSRAVSGVGPFKNVKEVFLPGTLLKVARSIAASQ